MNRFVLALCLLAFPAFAGTAIKSGSTSTLADVDANKNLQVVQPTTTTIANTGFVKVAGQDQLGLTTSGSFGGIPGTGATLNRLKVGTDNVLFYETFDGTVASAYPSPIWGRSFNTTAFVHSVTVAAGLTINSTTLSSANTNLAFYSQKTLQRVSTYVK